jgi:hypothetical protein
VKRSSADGSVGFPHVRVGHRQALILKTLIGLPIRVFFRLEKSCPQLLNQLLFLPVRKYLVLINRYLSLKL